MYYDSGNKSCKIYENRPFFCDVMKGWAFFSDRMTLEEYFAMTSRFCSIIEKI